MPRPICLVIVLIPAPRQPWQVPDAPLLDPFLKVQQTGNSEIPTKMNHRTSQSCSFILGWGGVQTSNVNVQSSVTIEQSHSVWAPTKSIKMSFGLLSRWKKICPFHAITKK